MSQQHPPHPHSQQPQQFPTQPQPQQYPPHPQPSQYPPHPQPSQYPPHPQPSQYPPHPQPSQFPSQPQQFPTPPQSQQQYPPPYQPPAPMGMLHLTIQGSSLTSNMIPPTVHLNGYPVPVKYGRNDIPVPAGPLRVGIYSQWMRVFGRATLDCTVLPNQVVPVFYASPYHQFASAGSIGHSKVKRHGIGAVFGLIGVTFAVMLLVILLASLN